jgi:phosphatidylglycerol:prolipoprotein diacylglycerol transferase
MLFHIGPLTITGYAALIDIGLLGGAIIACLEARRRGFGAIWALDAVLAAAMGGLIGGRAEYVATHWSYYGDYVRHQIGTIRALRIWDGGLGWHGALVGGLVTVLVYCRARRIRAWQLLDILTSGAAVLALCAWLGCLLHGCACGLETYPVQGWLWALSLDLPDLYGIWAPRVAVQLLGAGWSAATLVALQIGTIRLIAERRTRFAGTLFPLWVALHSFGCFGLGFLRADETLLVAGWRADQAADLALGVIGTIALLAGRFNTGRSAET